MENSLLLLMDWHLMLTMSSSKTTLLSGTWLNTDPLFSILSSSFLHSLIRSLNLSALGEFPIFSKLVVSFILALAANCLFLYFSASTNKSCSVTLFKFLTPILAILDAITPPDLRPSSLTILLSYFSSFFVSYPYLLRPLSFALKSVLTPKLSGLKSFIKSGSISNNPKFLFRLKK